MIPSAPDTRPPETEELVETLMATGRYGSRDAVLRAALQTLIDPPDPSLAEARLAAALDGMGEAFYALDRHWRFATVNRAAEAYFGRSRDTLIGRNIWEIFPWSAGTELRRRYEEAMQTRQTITFESLSVGRPDRFLEIRLFPFDDGIGASFRDLTEPRAAETALRESEARLRLAVEAGRLAVWEVDLATATIHPSPELNELLGFPPDAKPSMDELRAGYMPGEQQRLQAAGAAALARGERFFQVEYRYRRRNGEVIWLLLRAEVHFNGDKPSRVVGVVLDVTDRRQAEEGLRESQARLALAAGAADLGIWDWELATNRMIYSERARAIYGFPPDGEVTFEMVRDRTHPEDLPRTSSMVGPALDPAVRARVPYEYRVVRPDGTERWVLAHGEAVFETIDGVEKAVRYVGTIQDITEQRQAEAALRESQARLTALADNLPHGMVYQILTPADGSSRQFLYISRSCERVNGVSAEAAMKDPRLLYSLIEPQYGPLLAAAEAEAIAQRKPFDMVVACRHARTGEVRWLHTISAPRELPNGDLVWDGLQIDVTDQRAAEEALRESEARVKALTDNLPLGMVYQTVIAPDQSERRFLYLSQSCEPMNGVAVEAALADPYRLFELIEPEHLGLMLAREAEAMAAMAPFEAEVAARHAKTGALHWFRLMSAPRSLPNGEVIWDGIQIDITERKEAEEALRRSEERLRTILNEIPVGVILARMPDGEFVFRNAKSLDLLGDPITITRGIEDYAQFGAVHADGTPYRPEEYPIARTVLHRADIDQEEMMYRRPDGKIVQFAVSSAPIQGVDGESYAVSAFHDITERKKAESHQRLLINELNHRVKNTLATVQSIAAQSFRSVEASRDWMLLTGARAAFEARLFALSRTHDVLTRENWEGAGLREIVTEVTAPHCGGPAGREPFTIEGPDLRLRPAMALSLSMALHELCTNALKYGALGQPGGSVRIAWSEERDTSGRALVLAWRERGGPPVIPPTRRGFGTRLLERGLAHELGGEVRLNYDPSGLVCTLRVPLG